MKATASDLRAAVRRALEVFGVELSFWLAGSVYVCRYEGQLYALDDDSDAFQLMLPGFTGVGFTLVPVSILELSDIQVALDWSDDYFARLSEVGPSSLEAKSGGRSFSLGSVPRYFTGDSATWRTVEISDRVTLLKAAAELLEKGGYLDPSQLQQLNRCLMASMVAWLDLPEAGGLRVLWAPIGVFSRLLPHLG